MTRPPHASHDDPPTEHNAGPGGPGAGAGPTAAQRQAALLAVQPATAHLLSLWLAEHRWAVAPIERLPTAPDAVIAEVPFPRAGLPPALCTLARDHPGVPIVMLSPTIVAGTPSRGDLARQLGVAAVLGMPLSRSELLATMLALATPDR